MTKYKLPFVVLIKLLILFFSTIVSLYAQKETPLIPYFLHVASKDYEKKIDSSFLEMMESIPLQTFPALHSSGRNGSFLGEEVAGLGDINGDGYDDWAVGLPQGATYPAGKKLGKVYIYFGGNSLTNEKDPDLILYGESEGDRFGFSVASAGDVNNDNFADVIVGAYWNSAAVLFAGRAYLFLGGPNMDNIPDQIFTGEAAYDYFGNSVSSAGDVNNDGFDDLLIGACYSTAGVGPLTGRAYLYLGGTNMDNIPDLLFNGEAEQDLFAYSVSSAGDINNDGFSDLIIGAYLNDAGGVESGRAYIFLGGSNINNTPDLILTGEDILSNFGQSVSSAGDVNNDGFYDVVIGATGASRSYLYYGGINMDATPDVIMYGGGPYDNFGVDVSSAADVNNDGFSDVIVGASSGGSLISGSAYIFFGGINMNNISDVYLDGEAEGDFYGRSVSSIGDVNKDGYDDVITGAKWNDAGGNDAGRVYVYFGGANMNNISDVILTGEPSNDYFGNSVASAGDVNNDGYSDIIIGAYANDDAGTNTGSAYLYLGGTTVNNVPDLVFTGEGLGDGFGISVSSAGDVNNDGFSDILIGAYANGSTIFASGRAYIYFGGTNIDNIPDVILTGESTFNYFGNSVSSAGDVNNDGFDDVLIGAYLNDRGETDAGSAYIFYGGTNMNNVPDVILSGEASFDYFGNSVSSAGDVNNDGFDDVIIGAVFNNAGGSHAGRAYIYFGGTNMDNNPDIIMTGENSLVRFGVSVSSAGDVNGDGFSDVIVGASLAGDATGRAYIFYGASNMNNLPDVICSGEEVGDEFGISVAFAGDVNSDGFSDVIVGAQSNSTGAYSAGRSYVYFGGVNMNNFADGVFIGEASSDFFGTSVSSAGNVNKDNFADIIIGAPGSSTIGFSMGRAYLFSGGIIIGNIENDNNLILEEYYLSQNYPNPFNPVTKIKFSIPKPELIQIKVYNVLGKEIATIVNDYKQVGIYETEFNASELPSGVYFYQLKAGSFTDTKKMLLLK